ncbi:MAG: TolC family protein [Alloprevotella sp.]|nr:TolC family protein [Alloprevotella sp.]
MRIRLFLAATLLGLGASGQEVRRLTVEELFALVDAESRTLAERKASVEVTEQGVAAAKSLRLPDVKAAASVAYNGNILMADRDFSSWHGYHSPHFGNSLAVEAAQAVYTGGAHTAGIRLAELGRDMAAAELRQAQGEQRFMALGQYLDLFRIDNGLQVYRSNIALTRQLIGHTAERHAQGMALKNDLTRYELQLQSLELEVKRLEGQRSIVCHQLCHTLGLPTGTDIRPDSTIIYKMYAREGEAVWQHQARLSSPQLETADLATQIAGQQERMARSELRPKVSLFAANTFSGPVTFEIPPIDKNLNVWYVGVGLQYNISSLFKQNKRLRQARTQLQQAGVRQSVVEEQVDNAVQAAYTDYLQSFVELETRRKGVELAAQNYSVVSDRYENQLALVTDMVDAQNTKLQAELHEVEARVGIAFAYYKLEYITGKI